MDSNDFTSCHEEDEAHAPAGVAASAPRKATELARMFEENLATDVARLRAAHDQLIMKPSHDKHRQRVYDIAHDLKGHAGSFGYQLVSDLCHDLCDASDLSQQTTARQIAIIGFYISAMERVVSFNISGPGGEKARAFVERLRDLSAAHPG